MPNKMWSRPSVFLTVDLVILTLRAAELRVLLVQRGVEPYHNTWALPGGFLNHTEEDIADAAQRKLHEETSLDPSRLHLEQLGTYGTPGRDPRGRIVSVAYLAIAPELPEPVAGTNTSGAAWKPADEVLDNRLPLAFDHHGIVADGVERARSKLEHTALATAFCGATFTIAELQQVYEAVWRVSLDPRNFYRKVQKVPDFIVATGSERRMTRGRPARLFQAGGQTVLSPPLMRPNQPNEEE